VEIYSGTQCSAVSSLGVSDDNCGTQSTLTVAVTGNQFYTMVVDGFGGATGNVQPRIAFTAYCGNGASNAGEACDDGNRANGDGCNSSCQIEAGARCVGFGVRSCGTLRSNTNYTINASMTYSNTPQNRSMAVSTCPYIVSVDMRVDFNHRCERDVEYYIRPGTGSDYTYANNDSGGCGTTWYGPGTRRYDGWKGLTGNNNWNIRINDDAAGDDGYTNYVNLQLWCAN
jgi:cysteine-rich repeat protein